MSQENSGELELKVEEAVDKINSVLDKFSESAGINLSPVGDISVYLNYDDAMLLRLDADDAGNAAYMVSRHAAYIKRLYNRQMAIVRWSRNTLNSVAVKRCKQYVNSQYLKLEEKIAVVVAENEYARELNKQLMAADLKATELYDMHDQLNRLSDKLTDIQRTKRSERFQK